MENKFNFELTLGEIQVILKGLSKLPYELSAGIIDDIRNQYSEQLKIQEEKLKQEILKKAVKPPVEEVSKTD